MTLKESGDYKYILYLMDHFPKFHCLPRKASANVNTALTGICGTIGLPNISQTDNGSEFSKLVDIFRGNFGQNLLLFCLYLKRIMGFLCLKINQKL